MRPTDNNQKKSRSLAFKVKLKSAYPVDKQCADLTGLVHHLFGDRGPCLRVFFEKPADFLLVA